MQRQRGRHSRPARRHQPPADRHSQRGVEVVDDSRRSLGESGRRLPAANAVATDSSSVTLAPAYLVVRVVQCRVQPHGRGAAMLKILR